MRAPVGALSATRESRSVADLGPVDRDALSQIGDEVAFLHRVARLVNVLPLAFLLLWPVLAPRLIARGMVVRRLAGRPALRRLRAATDHVPADDLSGGDRLHEIQNRDARDLLALRRVHWTVGIALWGPPAIAVLTWAGLRWFIGG